MYSCQSELFKIELFICIKTDWALNNLQRLIYHKTQTISQPTTCMECWQRILRSVNRVAINRTIYFTVNCYNVYLIFLTSLINMKTVFIYLFILYFMYIWIWPWNDTEFWLSFRKGGKIFTYAKTDSEVFIWTISHDVRISGGFVLFGIRNILVIVQTRHFCGNLAHRPTKLVQ